MLASHRMDTLKQSAPGRGGGALYHHRTTVASETATQVITIPPPLPGRRL